MEAHAITALNPFDRSREKFEELVSRLTEAETLKMEHGEVEKLLEAQGRELMRRLFQGHLDSRGLGETADGQAVGSDGEERTHVRVSGRELNTLFGPVRVERVGYRTRTADTLFPRDAELNLPSDSYSHGVRRRVATEAAKGSFDAVTETMAETTGTAVPKRQAEILAVKAAQDFEEFYEQRKACSARQADKTGDILVLTVDGKGVVMRPEDLRPATRAAAESRTPRLDKRRSKGEKSGSKRMATVAAVYTIEPFFRDPLDVVLDFGPHRGPYATRPRPENKRVWASLQREPAEVIGEVFDEASRRDPGRSKSWVVLVDGNPGQLELIRREARKRQVDVTTVLDVIHVIEYLWKAAYVFHPEGSTDAQDWVSARLLAILCGKAGQVAGGIRRSATKRRLTAKQRRPADTCARYLLKYKKLLCYDLALTAGTPIATGVIEGACRHLIKDRMDITGARWSLQGAEAILRLRSLRTSGDFSEYWRFHERSEHHRLHGSRFAAGQIPATLPPLRPRPKTRSPHLRLVK